VLVLVVLIELGNVEKHCGENRVMIFIVLMKEDNKAAAAAGAVAFF
jgi:hypothetical protein